jgi:class 3 adenylate cyclase
MNLPPRVEQWYEHSDLRSYVHEQVAGTYDDKNPVNLDQQRNVVQVRTDAELGSNLASQSRTKREPEMGHVLFTDIVGYSKLPLEGQTEARRKLKEIVRGTRAFSDAQSRGNVISKSTGDGIALVFFGNPVAPVECAVEISKLLRTLSNLPLRMGIHSGPVNRDEDINQQPDVAGGGINYAQRVMDAGAGGQILLTRGVAEILYQLEGWSDYLHDLGEISVKHGVRLHVFNLYSDEFGNSARPEAAGPRTATSVTGHASPSSNDAIVRLALVREIDVNLDFLREIWNRILQRVTFQHAPHLARAQKGDALRALALPSWKRDKWDKLLEQATVTLSPEQFEKADIFYSKLERLTYLRAGDPDRWRIEAETIISDLVAEGNPLRQ